MTLLWIVQLLWDAFIFVGLAYWLLFKKGFGPGRGEEKLDSLLSLVESRVESLEVEVTQYRAQMQEQMARLARICEEAAQCLDRNRWISEVASPSREETELRSISFAKPALQVAAQASIPTLGDIEKTRERLKSEISLDLKSLLQEQLA